MVINNSGEFLKGDEFVDVMNIKYSVIVRRNNQKPVEKSCEKLVFVLLVEANEMVRHLLAFQVGDDSHVGVRIQKNWQGCGG